MSYPVAVRQSNAASCSREHFGVRAPHAAPRPALSTAHRPLCVSAHEECSTSSPAPPHPRRGLLASAALAVAVALHPPAAQADLPKGYTDTARSLVDALRDSIDADLAGAPEREVRRKADPAKDLVRKFMGDWRGAAVVSEDESYRQLTAAIQELGQFYMQRGQRARLDEAVGQALLTRLEAADAALPPAPEKKRFPF